MNIKLKCYHCQQSPDVLILLQPQNVRKHICIKCFAVRHPETSRETLESLLDEEQKAEIFAWWEHPITNAYTEAIAGLVKLTNHTGRGYSFKAIRAKLLYSNLPTFHRPVFDRSLEVRPPFTTMGEIKDYGVKFSTLYEMLGEV
jgi:hypothetical protein